jgi:hypothetical protein
VLGCLDSAHRYLVRCSSHQWFWLSASILGQGLQLEARLLLLIMTTPCIPALSCAGYHLRC